MHPLLKKKQLSGAVVQLVRIPACHAVGREFESRPHRKKDIRKGVFFVLRDSTFSRLLVSSRRRYVSRSLSKCHPRHFFTSAPQKKSFTALFLLEKPTCLFAIGFVFIAEVTVQAFLFAQHLYKHDRYEDNPYQQGLPRP